MDKVKAENMIAFLMGGRVAEEIVFNQKTTGAGNDIERATEVARKMVCEWGMSDILGPLTFGRKEEAIFLGREISQHRDYSEQTAQTIDREVRDIVERNYQRARQLLNENIAALHRIAEALLEYETIDGEEVDKLIRGEKLERPAKVVIGTDPKPEGGGAPAPVPV
ncbi:MAG: cell division protein FtsH, partial [Proteobacteria bacterium]|nr:cell division protein FtsH [Pseudomonadota bacterium]